MDARRTRRHNSLDARTLPAVQLKNTTTQSCNSSRWRSSLLNYHYIHSRRSTAAMSKNTLSKNTRVRTA